MTVGEVYRKFICGHPDGILGGTTDFAESIWARASRVGAYFAAAKETMEETLERLKFLDLTGGRELLVMKQRCVAKVPTVDQVYQEAKNKLNSAGQAFRSLPLGIVLGPSGSGKTFFALNQLNGNFLQDGNSTITNTTNTNTTNIRTDTDTNNHNTPPTMKCFTVYLFPSYEVARFFKKDQETQTEILNEGAAMELFRWIKERIAETTKRQFEEDKQLNMHISIIIDEAGAGRRKAWFESKAMLTALCREAQKLATSVSVVVSGTGLTGSELISAEDAFVFRMKPWKASDIAMRMESTKSKYYLADGETTRTVADAICSHPKLGALSTNARTAYFMVEAVRRCSTVYTRFSWEMQLDEWAPVIVSRVIEDYFDSNGINNLSRRERRQVAASIFFCALSQVKAKETKIPPLLLLENRALSVGEALLQFNLDRIDTKQQCLVDNEEFAISVSPAISIILFALAGIPTTLTFGGKDEMVELAALYAVRQSILQCMKKFASDGCQDQLDQSLEQVRLIRLPQKIESNVERISIPMVNGGSILRNSDSASFADVIAPYTLIQAKTTSDSNAAMAELYTDLQKCGLWKKSKDTRLLQGLLAMWQGQLVAMNPKRQKARASSSLSLQPDDTNRKPQSSRAYPENILSLVRSTGPIPWAVIQGTCPTTITLGTRKKISLPSLEDPIMITFLYATNADALILKLGRSRPTVTITEANLNEDMEIDIDTLQDSIEKSTWMTFITETVREGVKIKFLFTRSPR